MAVIGASIKYFLQKAFDIREGEYRRAMFMQLYIFLIISTLLIVKPTVYGLFLSKFGADELPWAFLSVAFFAAIVSSLYARSLKKNTLLRINILTLVLSITTLWGFALLLQANIFENVVIFLFYIWVALFGVLASSQFWILANIVFNPREAKRLFGFIGAGAIVGGIFGGYLTSILTQFYSSEILLFLCALMLLACIPLVWYLWKNEVRQLPESLRLKRKSPHIGEHPAKLIKKSRHLTYLAGIVAVSVIVAKLVDYQFSAVASARIPDPDELAAFFGFWFSTLNLVSLFIQLFLTRKVVGVFGVGSSLFFLPGGIMAGALLLLFIPELWAAIFIKVADGSLKQSINKASVELLALPIPPEIKSQTKTFIDVFVDSIATGISGIILIFLVSGLELPTRFISLMIIAFLALWVYFVVKIRSEYLKSFQFKIRQIKGKELPKSLDLTKDSVIGGMKKVLLQGSDPQRLFILNKLREIQDPRMFDAIKSLLQHPSSEIKAAALQNLYFYRANPILEEVKPLIDSDDDQVKTAAFEYMVHHCPPEEVPRLMENYLNDPDYRIRGAALVSLCTESGRNTFLQNAFSLQKHIHRVLEELEQIQDPEQIKFTKIHLLRAIAKAPMPQFALFIKTALKDSDPEIQGEALLTAGKSLEPFWIEQIFPFLIPEETREKAKAALRFYSTGLLAHFSTSMLEDEKQVAWLREIPSVIEGINNQQSVNFLFGFLDNNDLGLQMAALKSLNKLKIQFPHLHFDKKEIIPKILDEARLYLESLSVFYAQNTLASQQGNEAENKILDARKSLVSLMERRLDGRLERIFRLLGLTYPPEDILSIYEGIQSDKQELRTLAVEFLDNLLESELKSLLMPIVETAMLDVVSEKTVQQLKLKIPNEETCFRLLLEGKDIRVKLAVLYLIAQLKDPKHLGLVQQYTGHPNPKISDFAIRAKKALNKK